MTKRKKEQEIKFKFLILKMVLFNLILLVSCSQSSIKKRTLNKNLINKDSCDNLPNYNLIDSMSYQELFDSISKQKICLGFPDYFEPFQKMLTEKIAYDNIRNTQNNTNIKLVSFIYLRNINSKKIYEICFLVKNDTSTVSYVSGGWSINYNTPLFVAFINALGSVEDMKKNYGLNLNEINTLLDLKKRNATPTKN